jgi:hypothetical protein
MLEFVQEFAVIPALKLLRQEETELEVNLSYIACQPGRNETLPSKEEKKRICPRQY